MSERNKCLREALEHGFVVRDFLKINDTNVMIEITGNRKEKPEHYTFDAERSSGGRFSLEEARLLLAHYELYTDADFYFASGDHRYFFKVAKVKFDF
jgi:hypothetical protein